MQPVPVVVVYASMDYTGIYYKPNPIEEPWLVCPVVCITKTRNMKSYVVFYQYTIGKREEVYLAEDEMLYRRI